MTVRSRGSRDVRRPLETLADDAWYRVDQLEERAFQALRRAAINGGRVIEHDGLSVLGLGTAAEIDLVDGVSNVAELIWVRDALAAIRMLEPDGRRHCEADEAVPLALGALPFDRAAPGRLVVAETTVLRRAEEAPVAVTIGSRSRLGDLAESLTSGARSPYELTRHDATPPPDAFRLESARPHADFLERVSDAVAEIRTGRLDKVVLAREVTVHANREMAHGDLVGRLRALHPSCATFAIDDFLGATPELLICRRGSKITSHPLAGTAPRSGDPASDERMEASLLDSAKDRAEHASVVSAIAGSLREVVVALDVPGVPSIVELRNVCHLSTRITGELALVSAASPSALELVARLHPTPAVAGSPVEAALEYLAKAEGLDRDRYAGPVGWVDANGDGEWHLGIRSAVVSGSRARLFAGAGIVADSEPAAELAETQLKLQAFLAAAVRP